MVENIQIIVAGVGGQGSVLISHVLAEAAIREGYSVRVGEKFGAAMRGGAVSSHVRIAKGEIAPVIPIGEADAIMALEPLEGLRAMVKYLKKGGVIVLNTTPLYPIDVNVGRAKYPEVSKIIDEAKSLGFKVYHLDATSLAIQAGTARAMNSVMLGALYATGILPIKRETLIGTLKDYVPRGTEEVNEKAFKLGLEALGGSR